MLVRSEILFKTVSSQTELETLSKKKTFFVRSKILVLLAKTVNSSTTIIFKVANNLHSVTKILKHLYKLSVLD